MILNKIAKLSRYILLRYMVVIIKYNDKNQKNIIIYWSRKLFTSVFYYAKPNYVIYTYVGIKSLD